MVKEGEPAEFAVFLIRRGIMPFRKFMNVCLREDSGHSLLGYAFVLAGVTSGTRVGLIHMSQLIPVAAVGVALIAAATDLRGRRIPNRLTYPAIIVGLLLQSVAYGWHGLLSGLLGGLLFGGIFLMFHLLRAMGAGDVKLATALGCILGPNNSWQVLFTTAMAGGVLAIFVMIFTGRVIHTLRSTLGVVGFHASHGLRIHPVVNLDNPSAARMPYGVAFAAGTLYWAIFMNVWR